MLARALVVAAIAWPLVASAAVWQRASHADSAEPVWTTVLYLASSQICHQRPERSFHTHATQWPVCARCSGLYLAAPFGALAGLFVGRGFSRAKSLGHGAAKATPYTLPGTSVRLLALAAIPTALTLAWEWGGLGTPPNIVRFASALPLGAAVMLALVTVSRSDKLTRHGFGAQAH